jgi:hypothetical protein
MSNQFNEKSLTRAISSATAAYRHRSAGIERKRGGTCTDLVLEITGLQREIGRLSDDAMRLEDDAEELRRRAGIEIAFAVLSALGALAGAARGFAITARVLASRSVRGLTRGDVLALMSFLGPIGAAIQVLVAARDFEEADRLADRADQLVSNGERLGDQLLDALVAYDRDGCGSGDRLFS